MKQLLLGHIPGMVQESVQPYRLRMATVTILLLIVSALLLSLGAGFCLVIIQVIRDFDLLSQAIALALHKQNGLPLDAALVTG